MYPCQPYCAPFHLQKVSLLSLNQIGSRCTWDEMEKRLTERKKTSKIPCQPQVMEIERRSKFRGDWISQFKSKNVKKQKHFHSLIDQTKKTFPSLDRKLSSSQELMTLAYPKKQECSLKYLYATPQTRSVVASILFIAPSGNAVCRE